jgi:methyl-accepting chemotaxis protein
MRALPSSAKSSPKNVDSLESKITSDEGKKLVKAMIDTRGAYVVVLEKYLASVKSGERDAAMKLLYGEMRPVTDNYLKAIRNLVDFQDGLMKKVGKDADALARFNEDPDPHSGQRCSLVVSLVGLDHHPQCDEANWR